VPSGGKFEQLKFDLENRSRPTLVLAHYRATVDACVEVALATGATARAVHGGVSDTDKSLAIADFKAGKLDVLVGSLETLAEGLTLTVADTAIFVEMSYKPSRNEQARFRVHRMGQTRPVTIKEYVTIGSLDERKRRLLAQKTDQQMRVLTAAQFQEMV
jgi:superfamily II DNA or RNA helicase